MKAADVATCVVLLWGLAALAWPQPEPPRPTPQRMVNAISAMPAPSPQPIPDRRTLSEFPGP